MRPYETMVILSAELGDQGGPLIDRFVSIIEGEGGKIDARHEWGNRRLAFPIKKQNHGVYHLLEFHAESGTVAELERNLRITEGVLRFLSVQQEHTGLPEPRSEEPRGPRGDVPLSEMRSRGPRRDDRYDDRRDSRRDDRPAAPQQSSAPPAASPAPTPAAAAPAAEKAATAPAEAPAEAPASPPATDPKGDEQS